MNLIQIYERAVSLLQKGSDIQLLIIRLILAYGFLNPALMKLKDINGIGDWFGSIGIPVPHLNAYLATFTEAGGVILLALGLSTRLFSIPLIITMIVAILSVHLSNGFEAGNNGFEIPLYYIIMLLTLIVFGPGRFSLDHVIRNYLNSKKEK